MLEVDVRGSRGMRHRESLRRRGGKRRNGEWERRNAALEEKNNRRSVPLHPSFPVNVRRRGQTKKQEDHGSLPRRGKMAARPGTNGSEEASDFSIVRASA